MKPNAMSTVRITGVLQETIMKAIAIFSHMKSGGERLSEYKRQGRSITFTSAEASISFAARTSVADLHAPGLPLLPLTRREDLQTAPAPSHHTKQLTAFRGCTARPQNHQLHRRLSTTVIHSALVAAKQEASKSFFCSFVLRNKLNCTTL